MSFLIQPSAEWVPIHDTTAIVQDSALDLSKSPWIEVPSGKWGRLLAKGDHFEFEKKPGVPQRFYGANLCFSANFLTPEESEEFVTRLTRLGYNALRIHHYERELCGEKATTDIVPAKMAQLDGLLNACIRHGVYLTTDLFVSRYVNWRDCGIDKDGQIAMQEYKELVVFNEAAFQNYLAFARNLLTHVNPETGRRWADEPALALLALINEGNPGNTGYGFLASRPEFMEQWRAWLAERKAAEPEVFANITDAVPKNQWENSPQNDAFCVFLAELEMRFVARMRRFLRDEIKTDIPITDLSCWKNSIQCQLSRTKFDYVDDHFYVDHPQFLEKPWRLPAQIQNKNPVRSAAAGIEGVVKHRLLDKPFVLTEWNYAAPGSYRGLGGIVVGAQAALQNWDGMWRFAWSHDHDGVLNDENAVYFNVAHDPLERMTERAVLALFMRGDMKPLTHTFAVTLPESVLRHELSFGPQADIKDVWYGWYARFGTAVADARPAYADEGGVAPAVYQLRREDFERMAEGRAAGDGQIAFNRETGFFGIDTSRTVGLFAESGEETSGALTATVHDAPAAVWASSLDGKPVEKSTHLLLTHAVEVQDTDSVFRDEAHTILEKFGKIPHLMRAARADIALRTQARAVWALAPDGRRLRKVPSAWKNGTLTFTADTAADPSEATYCYELAE